MESTPVEHTDPPRVQCPECGGDTCVLSDLRRKWNHPSRVVPRIIWIVLFLGVMGYWVSQELWSYTSWTNATQMHQQTRNVSSLSPWGGFADQVPVYTSTNDLMAAIEGDQTAVVQIRELLQHAVDHADKDADLPDLESVRFGLKKLDGSINETVMYRFGGQWVMRSHTNMIPDVRDPNSEYSQDSYGVREDWGFFPRISYWFSEIGGHLQRSFVIDYITILGVLGVCMGLAWMICLIGRCCRIGYFRKRLVWGGLVMVLFLVSAVVALIDVQPQTFRASTAYDDVSLSNKYDLDSIRSITLDEDAVVEWSRDILALVPSDHKTELLVGQLLEFDSSFRDSRTLAEHEALSIGLRRFAPIFEWRKTVYPDEIAEEDLPTPFRVHFFRGIVERGALQSRWGTKRATSFVSLHIVNLALMPAVFYWLWVLLHWTSRRILARVQKRRVLRNQCIFCSYPLTAQAVNARYPREST